MTIDQAMALAVQQLKAGRFAEAETILRQVLAVAPEHPDALHLLGVICSRTGRHELAVQLIAKAIALKPGNVEAHNNLGTALKAQGNLDQAIAAYETAVRLKGDFAVAYGNLGIALKERGRVDEAIAAFRSATALNPKDVQGHFNLGVALNERGRFNEVVAAYEAAIALQPDFAEAHVNLAHALLQHGDFARGWAEYEWRWKSREFPAPRRNFHQPLWDGGDLAGRTILLHAEQGFGDTIQFARYLPLVAQRGGTVILECQPVLQRLLEQNRDDWQLIAAGDPLPRFDVHCPLLSLPLALKTTLDTVPAEVPYLRAESDLAAMWQERFGSDEPSLKVGLTWAGNAAFKGDRARSPGDLSLLAPLAGVKNVRFFSLQKGEAAGQAAHPPAGLTLQDWSDDLGDFADTAALVANLDVVIASDTAVAHLAGAMGKPVWVMLPHTADFRWLLEREDSPWYPTMRLFRQERAGDWESVVQRVADELRQVSQ